MTQGGSDVIKIGGWWEEDLLHAVTFKRCIVTSFGLN